jgi:hypothetical protein
MTTDQFEDALIAWGRIYGKGRTDLMEDRSPTGNSTLARIGGRPKKDDVVRRDGTDRRRAMGGGRVVPMWACDPIPCTETRTARPDYDSRETPVVGMIQSGWLHLRRVSHAYADAVRVHYQRRDVDRDSRPKLVGMTVREYRECVRQGRQYLAVYVGD